MKTPISGAGDAAAAADEEKKSINGELWQSCAGPLVSLPAAGTHVVYFPQGHSEQVAASMKKDMDAQIPNYPNLPSKLLCLLHSITLHADLETDEVYSRMTLQPVPSFDKDSLLRSDLSMKINKPQTEFFCKTLTASDTSTHGGFSVPRRAAEKIFPPLDFTMQPPAQELVARDLHDTVWTFRHIYRGQPKRHLLTSGWSLFVSGKRLVAGDSVLFIRDEKQQLLLGIRRANRQPPNLSSSVLSSDSMHIGILAAAAHAAANNSPFTVFYNPRTSPSEFVIPLAKYYRAVSRNQISLGMRFRMMFETEESGTRRYMGTVTGISDLDPVRWKNSQWRNLQVGWDESSAGDKRNRVSVWEIEPITAPFFICPTQSFFRPKRPRQSGMPEDESSDLDSLFRWTMPWLSDEFGMKDPQATLPGMNLAQWMNMQQNTSLSNSMQTNYIKPLPSSVLQNLPVSDMSRQLGLPGNQMSQNSVMDQLQKLPSSTINPLGSSTPQPQQQSSDVSQPLRQNLVGQILPTSHVQPQSLQSHSTVQAQSVQLQQQQQQQQSLLNHQLQRSFSQNLQQQQNLVHSQSMGHLNQQLLGSENQIQLQLLQKLHQQQQSLLAQSGMQQLSQTTQPQDQKKQHIDILANVSRPMTTNQTLDAYQMASARLSQSHVTNQPMTENTSPTNIGFAQPSPQPKLQQFGIPSEFPGPVGSSGALTGVAGGGQYAVTDDLPSCSTSPSTNNCPNALQSTTAGRTLKTGNEIAQSCVPSLGPTGLDPPSSNSDLVKDFPRKSDVKPSVNISKNHSQGFCAPQTQLTAAGNQADYLDSSSSATSVLSHNDGQMLPNNSFNSRSMLFRDGEIHVDPGNNIPSVSNIDNPLEMPLRSDPLIAKDMVGASKDFCTNLSTYENPKEVQAELSSSMVSQSFGVPDMAFNSMDSTINDGSFMNRGAWGPPQIPRMRTYTKVYKRGAVGRSIDITRYSGYDELKQDLARRFGIEGQLEDKQRIGWKLVYVDHENDVLLVGDDPWEEFVNCVRCIKILSPQEVQQMSLDGDFGNNGLSNQACSSSDNGIN